MDGSNPWEDWANNEPGMNNFGVRPDGSEPTEEEVIKAQQLALDEMNASTSFTQIEKNAYHQIMVVYSLFENLSNPAVYQVLQDHQILQLKAITERNARFEALKRMISEKLGVSGMRIEYMIMFNIVKQLSFLGYNNPNLDEEE